jgi:hypothetical protein
LFSTTSETCFSGSRAENSPKACHCDGDIRAQLVWHDNCCDEQLLKHDWLAVVVLLASGVPVPAAELIGAAGGTTQVV